MGGENYLAAMIDKERPKVGAVYQHYKGPQYRVHGIARHSETLEEVVYYECLYENELGKMWVRPLEMFMGEIELGGKTLPRFRLIS